MKKDKVIEYLEKIKKHRHDIEDYLIEPQSIKIKIKDDNIHFEKITLNLIKHDLKKYTDKEIILWHE